MMTSSPDKRDASPHRLPPVHKPLPECYPKFTTTSDAYVDALYRESVKRQEAEVFLDHTDTYDSMQKRWLVPSAPANVESLIGSIYTLVSSIMRSFVNPTEPGVSRTLDNTHGTPDCEATDEKGHRVCPVLVLQGTGPSFQIPKIVAPASALEVPTKSVGYSQLVSYFSVKLDSAAGTEEEQIDEMETYARRVLRIQPNRFYVRSLMLTETHARLFHFDRAGAQITPPINIHLHPVTLIRLIAGLSSPDEHTLGIDTSIQWTIANGRKSKGTLTTAGPDGQPKIYPILEQLRTPRSSIHGRATTCWRVQDPETLEELVVKDSWRPDTRSGEYELLEMVKGIPGVVQMISYETGRGETRDFRCPTTAGMYQNRIATRVSMKSYGPSIEQFASVLQILYALRDAIAGHRSLTAHDVRILHRDISVYNVLLGKGDAPEGERGTLIDLDLAFIPTGANPTVKVNYNIGIRIFQSFSVLGSLHYEDQAPAHDYLDDLESFFYLLAYLFLLYHPDGSRALSAGEGPSVVWSWSEDDASVAHANKSRFFGLGGKLRANRLVQEVWGPVCGSLFQDFRGWVANRREEKETMHRKGNSLETLLSQREGHYSTVLKFFDSAIEGIRSSTTEPTSTPADPVAEKETPRPPSPPLPLTQVPPAAASTMTAPASDAEAQVLRTPTPTTEPWTPRTPPPRAREIPSVYHSPRSPSHKRRSGDDEHPSSPRSKARRTNQSSVVMSRPP